MHDWLVIIKVSLQFLMQLPNLNWRNPTGLCLSATEKTFMVFKKIDKKCF